MTLKEAMKQRHMVRKYTDKPLSGELVREIEARLEEHNKANGLALKLVCGNADGLHWIARVLMGKGVRNYIVLAGEDSPKLDEKLGYYGMDAMLFAQTLGLNSWWIGGLCSKKGALKHLDRKDVKIRGVIPIGYGISAGVPHKSKKAEDIAVYKGNIPQWFKDGVEAVLLAPTAMNKQGYTIVGEGNRVSMTNSDGVFADVDLGIGKYHFELGAGKENFEWIAPAGK